MKTLTLKDMPDELLRQLLNRAAAEGRTLDEQVVVMLTRATNRPPVVAPARRAKAGPKRQGQPGGKRRKRPR